MMSACGCDGSASCHCAGGLPCGCCAGIEAATPQNVENRPGLPAITYRAGTYGRFLDSMLARLSTAPPIDDASSSPLANLRTRQPDDASIALLDAWATVADVLTFYQERIANEGYLRTAVERRSVLELARLVGYRVRPGVASSVHLAFTLQDGFDVTIPPSTAAKTTPGPGELPQTFETSDPIDARAKWNAVAPRRTRPQRITLQNANDIKVVYFAGVATRLKRNDRLLLVFGDDAGQQVLRRVFAVEEDQEKKRTTVTLQLEEFSAAQFVQDIRAILADRVRECPDLDTDPNIVALRGFLAGSHPLLVLSKDVEKTSTQLADDLNHGQGSVADLILVGEAAGKLTSGVTTLLDRPHAALADNLNVPLDGFGTQVLHATKAVAAIGAFDDSSAEATIAPRVKALAAGDDILKAEAETTAEFTALATVIRALHAEWLPIVEGLDTDATAAIIDANTAIDGALAITPPPTSQKDKDILELLKTTRDAFHAVADKPVGEKIATLETAADDVKGLKATDVALKARLGEVQQALKAVMQAAADTVSDAERAVERHRSLRLSDTGKSALQSAARSAQTLRAALPTASLRQQVSGLKQALDDVGRIGAVGLAGDVLDELTAALKLAPKTVVQDDLKIALDAVTLPTDLPDGSAKAHATTIAGLVTAIRNARTVFDATTTSDASAVKIAAEAQAIASEIRDAAGEEACVKATIAAFDAEQARFASHFLEQFQAIEKSAEARVPAADPLALAAIELLKSALAQADNVSVAALFLNVASAIAEIEKRATTVPPTNIAVAGWFRDLLAELRQVQSAISEQQSKPPAPPVVPQGAFGRLGDIATKLLTRPRAGKAAPPDLKTAFGFASDTVARSLQVLKPALGNDLLDGWGSVRVEAPTVEIYAFRVAASLFGYNAPTKKSTQVFDVDDKNAPNGRAQRTELVDGGDPDPAEDAHTVSLETTYDQVVPTSWIAVQRPQAQPIFARAAHVDAAVGLARYSMSGKTTTIGLASPADAQQAVTWFDTIDFGTVRGTMVWAQAEQLTPGEEPIVDRVGPSADRTVSGDSIELDGYFDGLAAGRFVAITGERTDPAGVKATELALIAAVEQGLDATLPGDTLHTTLVFTVPLQHEYKRETVTINANVAHATHGELQKEVLGSGDGSQTFQSFKLSKPPLTYLSKPTPSGAASTLEVRVNDILWHEADNLFELNVRDRNYTIAIDDDGTTLIGFGDGVHGARLPTGRENVRAVYRSGIGSPGNVTPKKIGVLPSPPLGVTAVSNPAAATGGADPETRDQARRNAPLAVCALDRLVSVRDYADFARTYAGIAKANAHVDSGAVIVTIAGIDDIPIDPGSDLFANLLDSMERFGDPHQAITLGVRRLKIAVLQADVAIDPDYDWKVVEALIRAALLDRFGFDRQELGAPVILSEVIAAIQRTAGVSHVDVEHFGSIREPDDDAVRPSAISDEITELGKPRDHVDVAANEIAYFTGKLPETIVLRLLPEKKTV